MSTRHKVSQYISAGYSSRVGHVRNVFSKHYAKVAGASLLVLSMIAGTNFALSQQHSLVTTGLEATQDQSSTTLPPQKATVNKATDAVTDVPKASTSTSISAESEVNATTNGSGHTEVTVNGQSIPVSQNSVTHQTVTNEGSGSTNITVQNTTTTNGSSRNSSTTNVDFYSSSSSDNFTTGGQ